MRREVCVVHRRTTRSLAQGRLMYQQGVGVGVYQHLSVCVCFRQPLALQWNASIVHSRTRRLAVPRASPHAVHFAHLQLLRVPPRPRGGRFRHGPSVPDLVLRRAHLHHRRARALDRINPRRRAARTPRRGIARIAFAFAVAFRFGIRREARSRPSPPPVALRSRRPKRVVERKHQRRRGDE